MRALHACVGFLVNNAQPFVEESTYRANSFVSAARPSRGLSEIEAKSHKILKRGNLLKGVSKAGSAQRDLR